MINFLSATQQSLRNGLKHHAGAMARLSLMVLISLGFTACASDPLPPTSDLQAAEMAVQTAEESRVAEYAPVEMREAREGLTQAKLAVEKKNMVAARRLANEALANAQLAQAKANQMKAEKVNQELRETNDTLQQELERSTGGQL